MCLNVARTTADNAANNRLVVLVAPMASRPSTTFNVVTIGASFVDVKLSRD
jgi:hypothetical protein